MSFRFAKIAARLIAAVPRGIASPPPPPAHERDQGVRALQHALRARAWRRQRRVVYGVIGAVTSIAAAAALILSLRGDPTTVASVDRSPRLAEADQSIRAWGARLADTSTNRRGPDLPDGQVVHAGQSVNARGPDDARLALSTGTVLELTAQARLDVQSLGAVQRFRLPAGRLHADVAPLDAGQRFVIETLDGEIEVHGTVFELAVVAPQPGCSAGSTTRVSVSRGVVEVRSAGRDDYVRAGQFWPPECPASKGLAADPAVTPAQRATAPAAPAHFNRTLPRPMRRALTVAEATRTDTSSPSDLAAQNNLFAAAMASKVRGQAGHALDQLERLIQRFPRGQLAEAAHAERMRLHRQGKDLPAARAEAREYLGSFPDGFAAAEARRILGLAPGAL
jgi:hypothetical protein